MSATGLQPMELPLYSRAWEGAHRPLSAFLRRAGMQLAGHACLSSPTRLPSAPTALPEPVPAPS